MDNRIVNPVTADWLAERLGLSVQGDGATVANQVLPVSEIAAGALCFSKTSIEISVNAVVIAPPDCDAVVGAVILSDNPRLDFCRALIVLESDPGFQRSTAEPDIHPSARIGRFADIGKGVTIGPRTEIASFCYIGDNVTIGAECKIRTGAIIGEEGYGFERDESGMPIRMPHLGSVKIGDRVLVGAATTVCRGTLSDTIVEDDVKIDDHVHIAHNCLLKRGAMVVACAEVSGGVTLGERSWVGPNAAVIQQLDIGDDALIGLGTVVIRSVDDGDVVVGNPAKSIRKT